MNNYPSGVTGREYAINGPDSEVEAEQECSLSGEEEPGMEYTYGVDHWFVCDTHGHESRLPDIDNEPDPDDARDRAIDRELDRSYDW